MKRLYTLFASLSIVLILLNSCAKEGSFEAEQRATGSLQDDASGNCLPKVVQGAYIVGQALNPDSNYIDVQVNVLTGGGYTITSDTLNGYSFSGSGSFSGAGLNTVRLKGNGTPVSALNAPNVFTIKYNGTFCTVAVPVLATGAKAVFTLVVNGTSCATFKPAGTFAAGTALGSTNTVSFDVNVTTPGTYSIATNTVNGYSFSGTGVFTATGVQTVTLTGTGKPVATGTDNFTVTAGASSCAFPITVTSAGTGTSGCGTANGTYTVGTTLGATNTVTVQHTYATAGTYTVSTGAAVNGISFSGSTTTTAANATATITLAGTGKPTAAGTNTYTINFGDNQTCTFTISVGSGVANTDYFPLTQGSYWTYNDTQNQPDTMKTVVSGTGNFLNNTYQKLVTTYSAGGSDNGYYRKDASGNYYIYSDTVGLGQSALGALNIKFNSASFEVLFLKNTLTTGQTWNNDYSVTVSGLPATLRFKYTCTDNNATLVVGGKTFTNVYKVTNEIQIGFSGTYTPIPGSTTTMYFAKGVGMIQGDDGLGATYQDIRFWQVL